MSGFCDNTECPNCGKNCDLYCDRKPYDYYTINCFHCGLTINPEVRYLNLDGLNEERKERGMRKLKNQPKQREI